MIQGISGRLISSSFIRDLLLTLDGCAPPPASTAAALDRWRQQVETSLGPAASPRAIADVAIVPLLELLDLRIAARTDTAAYVRLATTWDGCRGPEVLVVGWDDPLAGSWRESVTSSGSTGRWALCSNGNALRVVDAVRTWSRDYLEVDLAVAATDEQVQLLLWTFIRGSAIASTPSVLACAADLSAEYGTDICRALGRSVLRGLSCLLSHLAACGQKTALRPRRPPRRGTTGGSSQPAIDSADALFEQALTVLYRVLFLLFAEARGLVPIWHPIYRDRYSMGGIVGLLLEGRVCRGLWQAVQAISRLAHAGCRAGELRVNAFNGRLFSPAASTAFESIDVPDGTMAQVIGAVGAVVPARGKARQRVIYRDLDVEQLGAVYEQVLDYAPAPGDASLRLERTGDARKSSGSFYTPREVTAFLVRRTLQPLVDGRSAGEILQLRVLDPAMGSGAFLVAACRYLAECVEDALIREGRWHRGDVTSAERNELRREVASRCLYGVDLNPMAVQLGKLSLWLATLASDKPLSFLDHRLVCGDSLIGATPSDVRRQPPGEAGTRGRPALLPLFGDFGVDTVLECAARLRDRLATQPDATAEIVREKTRALADLTAAGTPLERWTRLLDLWCAIWFWSDEAPPNRALFSDLAASILDARGGALPAASTARLLTRAAGIAAARHFFHWQLMFPEVFVDADGHPRPDGGFDAIIGNPPWDMVRGDSGADAVRDTRRQDARQVTRFVRSAGIYSIDARSHVNRYQLFVERSLQLVRRGGRIGLVLPSGIATDTGAAPLRRFLLDRADVESLTVLDNRRGIFSIHRSIRFALLTCTTGTPTRAIACRFGLSTLVELEQPSTPIVFTRRLVERLSGEDDLGLPEVTRDIDLRIVEGVHHRHAWLSHADGWQAEFGRELNATDDRDKFTRFTSGTGLRPVLEGKHIDAFRVSTERCRYGLRRDEELPAAARHPRLVYRDVASASNRMTLIAAIAPAEAVTTHTLFCLRTKLSLDDQRVLCALLNSFVANFLIRLRVNTHVTVSLMSKLPVPVVRRGHPLYGRFLSLSRALLKATTPVEEMEEYAEMQALAALAYGLTEEEFERVLETFPLIEVAIRREALRRFLALTSV
jgi:hypothetical protein